MIATLIRLISVLIPCAQRSRWREEWLAEVEHAGTRGVRARTRLIAGLIPDAIATRRLARRATRAAGPRARIFSAFDQDLRYGLRGLVKAPGFTTGVILSLGVGIGANAAAFSFINAAVFRPFPAVSNQHELVRLTLGSAVYQKFSSIATPYRDFMALREGMTTLAALSAQRDATFAILTGGQAASVRGSLVSGNYFRVLGVTPAAGRFFLDDEDRTAGTHPVAVISGRLWDELFGETPWAPGQSLLVNGVALQIVGVTPRTFIGVRPRENPPRIWVPLAMGELALRDRGGRPSRVETAGPLWLDFIGRRRAGVTFAQVSAEAASLRERLEATRPDPRSRVSVVRVWLNDPSGSGPDIAAFMALPMLLLAIACVNAANLVLARSSRRVRDWTVRLAVGATRWRVVRQVLAEAFVLSIAAALLGLLLTRWVLSLIAHQVPVPIPIDLRVALFTAAIVGVTALTFSLGPAWSVTSRATRRLAPVSSGGGGAVRSRTRFALVALQAALSLGLLATGAQFMKTVQAKNAREHISSPEHLVLASFDVDPLRFTSEAADDFYRRLLERTGRIPGVAAAAFASSGLLTGTARRDIAARVWLTHSPVEGEPVVAFRVTPRLFEVVGMPLRQGRGFRPGDDTAVRAVVVNKAFADKLLNGQALGRTFRLNPPAPAPADGVEPTVTRVINGLHIFKEDPAARADRGTIDVTVGGVVDGIMQRTELEAPIVYYPAPLVYQPARTLYIRTDQTGAFSTASLQTAVREIDARVPAVSVSTLADIRQQRDGEVRIFTRAVGLLGLIALLLAAGGLYSVVTYVVSLRRQEVGIRIALGAEPGSIVGMIVRQALLPTLLGAALGAAGAAIAGVVIRSRMYGATPVDPWAFGGATLLMLCVMMLASWLPARQASQVDPIGVLRQE